LSGALVELFRKIAQAYTTEGDIIDKGSGKEAAIGNMNPGIGKMDTGIESFISPCQSRTGCTAIIVERSKTGEEGGSRLG
jgi:hypothetical protein